MKLLHPSSSQYQGGAIIRMWIYSVEYDIQKITNKNNFSVISLFIYPVFKCIKFHKKIFYGLVIGLS